MMKGQRKSRVSLAIDNVLDEKVRKLAELEERPLIYYYEKALKEYFENHKN